MSSIPSPTPAQTNRRWIVLAAAAFAILAPALQMGLGWGQSQAEFAAGGDSTLRVAGYAFSIWSLIYLGVAIYAVHQALPHTVESALINRFGWPSVVAFTGIGLWIPAAAFDGRLATLILITVSLLALLVPMTLHAATLRGLAPTDRDRWLAAWPLGLLAGWLTVAAPLNFLNVATAAHALPLAPSPTAIALTMIAMVTILVCMVTWRTRLLAYPLPVSWGLLGAFVAEQDRNPVLAFGALGCAVLILLAGVVLVFRLKPGGSGHRPANFNG